jgi:heme-degrading monooxygenase HmoA
MTELLALPPTPEAIASLSALPGSQINPVMLGTLRGPEGHLGPEAAGAILMLQATFTSEEGSESFWQAQAPLMQLLNSAPGFIRSFGFGDGPHNTLLVFWRTAGDAKAFAARPEHRRTMRDLYEQHWQYSHFAAIWEMTSKHDRIIFCPDCGVATPAAEQHCKGCGTDVVDPYRLDPDSPP